MTKIFMCHPTKYNHNDWDCVSILKLIEFINSSHTLAIDIETTSKKQYSTYRLAGLDPHTSDIVSIQIGNDKIVYILDVRFTNKQDLERLRDCINQADIKWIGHNIKFDYKMLKHLLGIELNHIADTFLLEKILYSGYPYKGYSLEKLCKRYLKFQYASTSQLDMFSDNKHVGVISKSVRNTFANIGDKLMSFDQILYGAKDVENTYKIYFMQLPKIARWEEHKTMLLEHYFLKVSADIELRGMRLNTEKWLEIERNNIPKFNQKKDILYRMIKEENIPDFLDNQLSLFESSLEPEVAINLASAQQVVKLCKILGIPTEILDKKKTKEKGFDVFKDSVEERHLRRYEKDYPIISPYLEYKKYEKAISTYGSSFLKNINPNTGRVHSNINQILETGRTAMKDPNLQNIPTVIWINKSNNEQIPNFRFAFDIEDSRSLVVSDYSGQESRILAYLSGDKVMLEFFLNGDGDLHSHTARLMFKVEVSRTENTDLRHLAKIINFGIAYGMSAYKLSNDFNISIEEAEEFIEAYFRAYPGLKVYFERCKTVALQNGYILIDKITNRRSWNGSLQANLKKTDGLIKLLQKDGVKVPSSLWSEFYTTKGQIERNSQNYPIQGTAANMTKVAAILLRQKILLLGLDAFLVNIVHDELVTECAFEIRDQIGKLQEESMLEAGRIFCPTIPMEVETNIGKVWDH